EYVYKTDATDKQKIDAEWNQFTARRQSWNLLYELAGYSSEKWDKKDVGDIAGSHDEYILLRKWDEGNKKLSHPIVINVKDKTLEAPELGKDKTFKWSFANEGKLPEKTT